MECSKNISSGSSNVNNSSSSKMAENLDYNKKTVDFQITCENEDVSEDSDTELPADDTPVYIDYSNEKYAEKIISLKPINEFTKCYKMNATFSTKTAQLLHDILPAEVEIIRTFDTIRKQLKLCKTRDNLLEESYMDIVARLEVKIINREDKLKLELTNMEQQLWQKEEGLSLIPQLEMDKNEYDSIISELKIVNIARRQLKI